METNLKWQMIMATLCMYADVCFLTGQYFCCSVVRCFSLAVNVFPSYPICDSDFFPSSIDMWLLYSGILILHLFILPIALVSFLYFCNRSFSFVFCELLCVRLRVCIIDWLLGFLRWRCVCVCVRLLGMLKVIHINTITSVLMP